MNISTYINILKEKKKQDFFIYGMGQAFSLVTPLLVIPYIVYVCGEDGNGKIGLSFLITLFLILIVDYGFEIKSPKNISENRDSPAKIQQIANTTFYSKFIIFILVFIGFSLIIWFVPFFHEERVLYFLSISIILAQVFNPTWFLQGLENFKLISVVNIGSKVTYMLIVYAIVKRRDDYIYVNLILGLSSLLFNAGCLIYITSRYKINLLVPDFREIRAVLRTDFSLCVSQLFLSARQVSPSFIISYFLGYTVVGQYNIIERVVGMFRTFIQVFLRFFYAPVCYKVAKNAKDGFAFWKKYTGYSILIMVGGAVVLYIFSAQVLGFFNISAVSIPKLNPVFRLALIIPLIMSFSYPLEQLMFVVNRNKIYVRIIMSVAVLTILVALLVVNLYGIIGIVVSLLLSEVLVATLYFKYSYLFIKEQVNAVIA